MSDGRRRSPTKCGPAGVGLVGAARSCSSRSCASASSCASRKRCSGCSCSPSCWPPASASRSATGPPDVVNVAATEPAVAASLARTAGAVGRVVRPCRRRATRLRAGRGRAAGRTAAPTALSSYRYDDTNPKAGPRARWPTTRIQRAAGRDRSGAGQRSNVVREAGSRYIDFLVPGLVGIDMMGSGIWGLGFAIVDARRQQADSSGCSPRRCRARDTCSPICSGAMLILCVEVGAFRRLRRAGFRRAGARSLVATGRAVRALVALVQRARPAAGVARADDRRRVRPHEPRHAADVDSLRRVLLGAPLPRDRPALHHRPAAHGDHRRAARAHAAGCRRLPRSARSWVSSARGSSYVSRWRCGCSAGDDDRVG